VPFLLNHDASRSTAHRIHSVADLEVSTSIGRFAVSSCLEPFWFPMLADRFRKLRYWPTFLHTECIRPTVALMTSPRGLRATWVAMRSRGTQQGLVNSVCRQASETERRSALWVCCRRTSGNKMIKPTFQGKKIFSI
jgi:hypothetical protein